MYDLFNHFNDFISPSLQRVRKLPNVTILEATTVTELIYEEGTVLGVRMRQRKGAEDEDEEEKATQNSDIKADFVVEAGGRSSKIEQMLEKIGVEKVPKQEVEPYCGYVTACYLPPEGDPPQYRLPTGTKIEFRIPSKDETRAAAMAPIENGMYLLVFQGYGKDYPPTDPNELVKYCEGIKDSEIFVMMMKHWRCIKVCGNFICLVW
jgi:2-polyprenyl-6-methoxyphenol hydroxylase-like FAD-dependent oxidoreductase